jgi:hypothetical protein
MHCVISYYFYLYLLLNAYAVRFDVMENINFFYKFFWVLNKTKFSGGSEHQTDCGRQEQEQITMVRKIRMCMNE